MEHNQSSQATRKRTSHYEGSDYQPLSKYRRKSNVWSRLGNEPTEQHYQTSVASVSSNQPSANVWSQVGNVPAEERYQTSVGTASSNRSSTNVWSRLGNEPTEQRYQTSVASVSSNKSLSHHIGYRSGSRCESRIEFGREHNRKRKYNNSEINYQGTSASKPWLGYNRLNDLTRKSSSEVVAVLANSHSGFEELLHEKLSPDFIHHICKVLAKVADADFNQNKSCILTQACRPVFLDQLMEYFSSLPLKGCKNNFEEFVSSLLIFYKSVLNLLHNTACDRFVKIFLFTDMAINGMEKYQHISISSELKEEFKCLQEQLKSSIAENEKKARHRHVEQPPNNFREISVYPTSEDLLTSHLPFLRPNIISGAYLDVEHYLDVQFRLLREDFVCPLRDGITNYLSEKPTRNKNNMKRVDNVRFYKNVTFDSIKVMSNRIGMVVKFDLQVRTRKIRWENSKRFMYGALLCFSHDNFRTVVLATVIDRDVELLKTGSVVVELCVDTRISESLFSQHFIMAESEVYFEPYFHVLKGLQAMKEETFPMKKYIVDVDCTEHPPKYLEDKVNVKYRTYFETLTMSSFLPESPSPSHSLFSFSPESPSYLPSSPPSCPGHVNSSDSLKEDTALVEGDQNMVGSSEEYGEQSEIPGSQKQEGSSPLPMCEFSVLDFNMWPSSEQFGLDASQYRAFRAALTREFVVIQGPPGTGKTYLGLKVTEFLLKNSSVWNNFHHPILIVCYTNHALDQFLEGLIPITEKLVRVGGQSKNARMKPFNLKEKRRERGTSYAYSCLSRDIKARMECHITLFKKIQLDLEALVQNTGIVSLQSLKLIMGNDHFNFFAYSSTLEGNDEADMTSMDHIFVEWLLENRDMEVNQGGRQEDLYTVETEEDFENLEMGAEIDSMREAMEAPLDLDVDLDNVCQRLTFAVTIEELELELVHIESMRKEVDVEDLRLWFLDGRHDEISMKLACLKYELRNLKAVTDVQLVSLKNERNLSALNTEQRWILYSYWLQELQCALLNELTTVDVRFKAECKKYDEVKNTEDLEIMKNVLVVGMTTTGAARLQPLLQALKPPIVIVEEAAEVLEAHIITAVTRHCQHLILIGDHQQLKPTTAVYKLKHKFKLDTSLFERMVHNGMPCEVLNVQHRMRPEIAQLIVPSIYPDLQNHSSVLKFPAVRGIIKNLFFITHKFPDEEVSEMSSRRNVHEANFLLALCKHLILQGYDAQNVTILTTYKGQMFFLRNEQWKSGMLSHVRITVVDNFQGEESDIILLSLVRSNSEGKIGFLRSDNRVCVALSRARHGLYIIGNMDDLTEGSEIWKKIKETLMVQDALGTHLTLQCEIHPDQLMLVSCAKDFEKVPEGGCNLECGVLLRCGHSCKSVCHVNNRDHSRYKCPERCERKCILEHPCKKQCWMACGKCKVLVLRKLPCLHEVELECYLPCEEYKCKVQVMKKLPACEHETVADCSKVAEYILCPFPCEIRLHCGHKCACTCHPLSDPDHLQYKCRKPCTRYNAGCSMKHECRRPCYEDCSKCTIEVEKVLPRCGHSQVMMCGTNSEEVKCKRRCSKILPCGHKCPLTCADKCGGCRVTVTKVIPECGHKVKTECSKVPDRKLCTEQKCDRILECGHKCKQRCALLCTIHCTELVDNQIPAACGHVFKMPCHRQRGGLLPELSSCDAPCDATLACGHLCSGTCGKCYQGRIHLECAMPCGKELICGHRCDFPCAMSCPPCMKKCTYRCRHSRCGRKCGQPCTPCMEPCEWRCKHYSCTRKCYELCNRPPCNAPCTRKLKCGHRCIGFCGEKCPDLCRVCDAEKVTTVFLGHEDEKDARFVFLEDCQHTVEAKGLEQWLSNNDDIKDTEITMKVCPQCKTPISRTQRYMNIIKTSYKDVHTIKMRVFGNAGEIMRKTLKVSEKLSALHAGIYSREFQYIYSRVMGTLHPKKSNLLSRFDVEMLEIQTDILCELEGLTKNMDSSVLCPEASDQLFKRMKFLLTILKERSFYLSQQEVGDFNLELQRFRRFIQLWTLESTANFQHMKTETITRNHQEATKLAFAPQRYSEDTDKGLAKHLENLKEALKSTLNIMETERKQIVKAMDLKQGHWYKCPNDHIYAITECGGAMQEGKCNECGEKIGGSRHTLLPSNSLATEMDGATHSAWCEAANLENYNLDA